MDLEIIKIIDHTKPKDERVLLKVTADTNLQWYAICDNTYKSGTTELSNKHRNFFWFPDLAVKKGEYVRLWTKDGTYSKSKPGTSTVYYHELYWGLPSGVWNNDGDLAVLIEVEHIETHVVKKDK